MINSFKLFSGEEYRDNRMCMKTNGHRHVFDEGGGHTVTARKIFRHLSNHNLVSDVVLFHSKGCPPS